MSIELCRLDELAEIKLGVKTFINQFFYVDEERVRRFKIEERFLEPVFRVADTQRDRFSQRVDRTAYKIFLCDTTVDQLVGSGAADYIKWAASQRYEVKGGRVGGLWKDTPAAMPERRVWYQNQAMPPPARIAVLKLIDETFAPLVLDQAVRVDQSFNQVNAKPGVEEELVIAILCSAWLVMALETFGRTAMGQGALQVPTETLRGLMVPDVRTLNSDEVVAWKRALEKLLSGKRLPASQLGSTEPQRELDALVLESLGFAEGRLDELYGSIVAMGKVRRSLASGRSTIKRERFETDVEGVARDIASQLKPLLQGRRFPQDFLPSGASTATVQLGTEPLVVRCELMMGERHVVIASAGTEVFESRLPGPVGEALVRALELHQRSLELPEAEAAAESALVDLYQLTKQLDARVVELAAHASPAQQAAIRNQVEETLNFPISRLLEPLPGLYEAELL
jgi:hypothetical protein